MCFRIRRYHINSFLFSLLFSTRRMTELLNKSDRQYTLNGLHTNASYAVQVMKYDKFAWRVG